MKKQKKNKHNLESNPEFMLKFCSKKNIEMLCKQPKEKLKSQRKTKILIQDQPVGIRNVGSKIKII